MIICDGYNKYEILMLTKSRVDESEDLIGTDNFTWYDSLDAYYPNEDADDVLDDVITYCHDWENYKTDSDLTHPEFIQDENRLFKFNIIEAASEIDAIRNTNVITFPDYIETEYQLLIWLEDNGYYEELDLYKNGYAAIEGNKLIIY